MGRHTSYVGLGSSIAALPAVGSLPPYVPPGLNGGVLWEGGAIGTIRSDVQRWDATERQEFEEVVRTLPISLSGPPHTRLLSAYYGLIAAANSEQRIRTHRL